MIILYSNFADKIMSQNLSKLQNVFDLRQSFSNINQICIKCKIRPSYMVNLYLVIVFYSTSFISYM